MLIVQKREKVNCKVTIVCFIVLLGLMLKLIPLHPVYGVTLQGILTFVVLMKIGENIKAKRILVLCEYASRYSYAIFLTHHVIIQEVIGCFRECNLTQGEGITLFVFTSMLIICVSMIIHKIQK